MIQLTEQQLSAIDMVKNNQFSILTGKPGTGKTTTVRQIIEWAISTNLHFLLCAPTGKAAKRMAESTGYYAATIHSTLGCTFENGYFEFISNENNPLHTDLVIVDEVSMVTNNLMSHLLRAIDSKRTKVLLIGDAGQLPSVGAGAVLRDMLASEVIPHTELDIIHRNSGAIVSACAAIHAGQSYQPEKQLDLEAENPINLIHIESPNMDMTLDAVEKVVCERMPLRGYDPRWDVQVISPTNVKTALSCQNINRVLQKKLNENFIPDETESDTLKFFTGDKVINTKNQKAECKDGKVTVIVNGDVGVIDSIDGKNIIVTFFEPDRTVKLSRANNNLLHAYAITCHRFQGSEAPVIIIPIHKSFAYFTNRKWIYTAISRAKDICITIGDFVAIDMMIRNTNDVDRCTMLKDLLVEKNNEIEFAGI